MKQHKEKLSALIFAYDTAELGYRLQEERINAAYHQTLLEHEFLASESASRFGIEQGQRIFDPRHMFLLSKADFDRLYALAKPLMVKERLIKEDDTYVMPWTELKVRARQEAVDFIIENIVPEDLRDTFRRHRLHYVYTGRLLDMARKFAA